MLALTQPAQALDVIAVPSWMMGMFGAIFIILLGVIGFLLKYVLGSFKSVILELRVALEKAVEAFQEFEREAPKEFVTHTYFSLARREQEERIVQTHKRINEVASSLQKTIDDHKRECPGRGMPWTKADGK
jgi:cell shape-determining protein MreC